MRRRPSQAGKRSQRFPAGSADPRIRRVGAVGVPTAGPAGSAAPAPRRTGVAPRPRVRHAIRSPRPAKGAAEGLIWNGERPLSSLARATRAVAAGLLAALLVALTAAWLRSAPSSRRRRRGARAPRAGAQWPAVRTILSRRLTAAATRRSPVRKRAVRRSASPPRDPGQRLAHDRVRH
jgi:hypothetical protein